MNELCWDGFANVRDLGGLPTRLSASGRTAQWRVARGPRRERLTNTGWADAREWGLRTIVDLRCHDEVDALERALRDRFPEIIRIVGHAEPAH